MMPIREMCMAMSQAIMPVPVPMALADRQHLPRLVRMLMMLIMGMLMLVLQTIMAVSVAMRFGQVQPQADGHKQSRKTNLHGHGLLEKGNGHKGAYKRRQGKISTTAGGAYVAQSQDKENQTDAIAKKTDGHGQDQIRHRRPGRSA